MSTPSGSEKIEELRLSLHEAVRSGDLELSVNLSERITALKYEVYGQCSAGVGGDPAGGCDWPCAPGEDLCFGHLSEAATNLSGGK